MASSVPVAVTRMTFDDEFNTFSNSPDGSTGTWMTSFPYNGNAARTLSATGEEEYYSDSSVGVNPFGLSNGILSITATPGSNPYKLPYNSGLITTNKSFSQEYGYFEVSAQLPLGTGLWPAFWMVPQSYTAELDIFEEIGQSATTVYNSLHGTTNGAWSNNTLTATVPNIATGFNTFGVDWEPTTTTFYVNGIAVSSGATPSSMNMPMYMLLNLAVGGPGSWPGPPNSSTVFPATMKIDYVHAYATANTAYVGGRSAIPPGVSANDSVITASGGGSIIDTNGNAWTIVNGQVTVNGTADYMTYGVTKLAYVNSKIWQDSTFNQWSAKALPSDAWTPSSGTSQPPIAIKVTNPTTKATSTVDGTTVGSSTQNGSTFNIAALGNTTAVLGSSKTTIAFVGMTNVTVTGGSAAATITDDGGTGSFTAGKGVLDITGGPGNNTYILKAGTGGFIIEDFSTQADILNIAASLQSAMTIASDGHGGTLLSFGSAAGTIDVKGIASLPNSVIHWF